MGTCIVGYPDTSSGEDNVMKVEKPLFVPLRTEWFRKFKAGLKTVEYRRYGPGWNEGTCRVGRSIVLSHGYSGERIEAVIVGFRRVNAGKPKAAAELYGKDATLAAITVQI